MRDYFIAWSLSSPLLSSSPSLQTVFEVSLTVWRHPFVLLGEKRPLYPLTPKSDMHLISPHNVTPGSHIKVTRIKERSSTEEALDSLTNPPCQHLVWWTVCRICIMMLCKAKSVQSAVHAPQEMYWEQYGDLENWC